MRQKLYIGVDTAIVFLFHPADFENEFDFDSFEFEPPDSAFEDALVMGLRLGADGTRGMLFVFGELSDAERERVKGPLVFPLRVNHGRLFATDRMASVDEHEWHEEPALELDEGCYEARWYLCDEQMSEQENINWMVTLHPVEDLAGLKKWRDFPNEDDF